MTTIRILLAKAIFTEISSKTMTLVSMGLWESMEGIIPRTSPYNLDVRLSVHPASETLNFCFCSCAGNRGMIHGLP